MNYTLSEIWDQFSRISNVAYIDYGKHQAYIYKGVKITKKGSCIDLWCTDSEYYSLVKDDVLYEFLQHGIKRGIKSYLNDKNKSRNE